MDNPGYEQQGNFTRNQRNSNQFSNSNQTRISITINLAKKNL